MRTPGLTTGRRAARVAGALIGLALGAVVILPAVVVLSPGLSTGQAGGALTALAVALALTAALGAGAFGHLLVPAGSGPVPGLPAPLILDTSALIDGRIRDIVETGFLDGRLLVAGSVLRELQNIADSPDPQRRARGRRGLEVLAALKSMPGVSVDVAPAPSPAARDVDHELVELARSCAGRLLTTDFNLNRVARVRDVPVLNVNDLAHALRPAILPGETLRVSILKEGREPHQGVAYLDDGTMIVVEDGRPLVGRTVDIVVTSALQTAAGRMFFARSEGGTRSERRESAL